MKKYNSRDYLYICGLIKTKERYLLTQDKVEKMIESKNPDDALKVLYELDYGFPNDEIPAEGFETLLSRELEYTFRLILSLAPEPEYFEVFLYTNDYHNVKSLLKAELLGISAERLMASPAQIPEDELIAMVRDRDYSKMREHMAEGIRDALDKYSISRDPQMIDLILDQACYRDINKKVSEIDNKYIKEYMSLRIDTINLKSFVRIKAMGKSFKYYEKVFYEGGKIPVSLFAEHYNEPPEKFEERLGEFGMRTLFHEGTLVANEIGSFAVFEKLCDNLLMDFIRETKHIAYGIQPLVNYIVAKKSELKSARIIMTGKLANIPEAVIWERIRHTYV